MDFIVNAIWYLFVDIRCRWTNSPTASTQF